MKSIDGLLDPKLMEENNLFKEFEQGKGNETDTTANPG